MVRVRVSDGFNAASAEAALPVQRPLTALTTLPGPDLTGVSIPTEIVAQLSNPLRPSTAGPMVPIEPGVLRLTDAEGREVLADVVYRPDVSVLILTPAGPLRPGTRYTVTLGAGLADRWGGRLPEATPWSFVTAQETSATGDATEMRNPRTSPGEVAMSEGPIRRKTIPRAVAVLALGLLSACGGGGAEPRPDEGTGAAGARAAASGSFELGEASYAFAVRRCDLTGSAEAGILLSGSGTAPDGRRLSVEVERLRPGNSIVERATVYFGSIMEGDHWTASRRGSDGRWFSDDALADPVDGPLLRISGPELHVEGEYRRERDGSVRPGTLRARCDR